MLDVQRSVGRYQIQHELGRGGMATVYLARQTDLDRDVALKELGSFRASDQAFAERFLRESRVVGSLSHPNIVTVYDYFEDEATPYISMEFIEGGSLRPWIGKLSLEQVAGALEGLFAGLAHAETRGIVHRDLKPENLMVTAEGTLKIADFGIAKALNRASTGRFLTATGTTVGTPSYMAPEQAMAKDIGPWTDLYSAGVIAYEMLVGQVPFHDTDTPMAILLRHVNEPIPSPRSVKPDLDPALAAWLERLLAKAPADRTQSARDAWDELEEIVLGLLGPRWRRAARLIENGPSAETAKPLTPAPFHEETGVSRREPEIVPPGHAAERAPAEPLLAPTTPPEVRAAAGATSFEWPAFETERKGRMLLIGGAVLGAVLTAVLGFVLLTSGDAKPTPPVNPLPPVLPKPEPKRPTLTLTARSLAIRVGAKHVIATLRFADGRLRERGIVSRDANMRDGHGLVEVHQEGIRTAVGLGEVPGLRIRVRRSGERLKIVLSAKRRAFTAVAPSRDSTGRVLALRVAKTPPAPQKARPRSQPEREPDLGPQPDPERRSPIVLNTRPPCAANVGSMSSCRAAFSAAIVPLSFSAM